MSERPEARGTCCLKEKCIKIALDEGVLKVFAIMKNNMINSNNEWNTRAVVASCYVNPET